ncbi:MAG: hypothetical protein JXQ23_02625 [Clostridia bacterium]|nr:hypothetical protein [Clostridia bacterium]
MDFNKSSIISIMIIFLFSLIVIFSIKSIDNNYAENQVKTVEKTIKQAIVQCYALEGSYPPDLEYLKENYGIIINTDKYIYHYEIFASNIMPILKVFPVIIKEAVN